MLTTRLLSHPGWSSSDNVLHLPADNQHSSVTDRGLNEHWSLVAHLTDDVRQTDGLVGFYQTHGRLHCYQHARTTDTSTAPTHTHTHTLSTYNTADAATATTTNTKAGLRRNSA